VLSIEGSSSRSSFKQENQASLPFLIVSNHENNGSAYWTAAVDSAADHDSAEYGFALASSPCDQRWLRPIWASEDRKTRHGRAHDCARGQTVAETVQTTHRGFTTDEPVELVVFYAGQVGLPITINEE
jgi:hypothetical protein